MLRAIVAAKAQLAGQGPLGKLRDDGADRLARIDRRRVNRAADIDGNAETDQLALDPGFTQPQGQGRKNQQQRQAGRETEKQHGDHPRMQPAP